MKRVPTPPDFVAREHEVLDFWKDNRSFEALRQKLRDKPLFRFVDGPITANNPMGVHHAWGRTLKDVFIRYKAMTGHNCRFQNGFDCQGLWVEVEVEKALGFDGKKDIEEFGLDRFSEACNERVETFAKVITDQSIRLGQWMDWDNSYYTHSDLNITSIWHFLKVCADNGWLYKKGLPMPWCPRCGTSLSEHEMAGSHAETEHLSIYGRVPLKDRPDTRLLIWTTTPWTLAANTAAAVNPDLSYVEVSSPDWDHTLILAKDALGVLKEFPGEILREFPGRELVGLRFETFFPDLDAQKAVDHRIVAWDLVGGEEGSGIVHMAPGCGREDFEVGTEQGLAVVVPVDDNGVFVDGFGFLTGKVADQVPEEVAAALDAAGKLLKTEMYSHSYPHCWRCKGELIFRLVEEWFIRSDDIRPRLIEAARSVNWRPDYIGKRMENWLTNMGDWCISRKRFWGLPLPFYPCRSCGETTVLGSKEALREHAADPSEVDALQELHRPWIDAIKIRCPACEGEVERVKEVGDCWMDAGIVTYSTTGYFDDPSAWKEAYPIEWICEMREQVRLWFYSMLYMGVAIGERAPYEDVLTYERVVHESGKMFSKTGYMIPFDEAVEKMGADAMRWLFCRQPITSEVRFGYHTGQIATRRLTDLWNIYAFFVTYALIDSPEVDVAPSDARLRVTDRWLLARTARMLQVSREAYETFDTSVVVREVEEYLDEVSNWYVRVSRRRFWRAGADADKQACYGALYQAIKTTTLVLAPIVPFVTEAIWQNLVRSMEPDAPESVHHADWPDAMDFWVDPDLLERTAALRKVIGLSLNLRDQAGMRVRQPLPTLYVMADGPARKAVQEQGSLLEREVNVRRVTLVDEDSAFRSHRLSLNFKKAGPVLRGEVNHAKEALSKIAREPMAEMVRRYDAGESILIPGIDQTIPADIFVKQGQCAEGFLEGTDGDLTAALDVRVNAELHREGLARDLVRKLQVLRRTTGLELTDRIALAITTDDEELRAAVDEHRDYIMEEVLAATLANGGLDEPDASEEWELQERTVKASIRVTS
jgi:isoleucyl-tRNA synthetase